MRKLILVLVLLLGTIACAAQPGRVETSLAGVRIGASLSDAKRILGSPSRIVDLPDRDLAWRAGERQYYFNKGHVVVEVVEDYYQKAEMRTERSSGVLSISIQGDGSVTSPMKTSLGLALGDSLQTIRSLYGKVHQVQRHIQVRWPNGNILDIDLDAHDRVSGIELHLDQS